MSTKITDYQDAIHSLEQQRSSLATSKDWITLAEKWKSEDRQEKVIFCYEKALEFLKTDSTYAQDACYAAIEMGHAHRRLGHHRPARHAYQLAVSLSQVDTHPNEAGANAYFHLASLAQQTWNLGFAVDFYRKSKAIYELLNKTDEAQALETRILDCQSKKITER
ncbi:MAG: hypothetical protein VW378_05500 [bacterium]